jgi:hypothetical protein
MRSRDDIKAAAVPFPDGLIEQVPSGGGQADYVAWYHYTQRLLATVEDYGWQVVSIFKAGDEWTCHGRLTVEDGLPKDGVGLGSDPKAAASDALKRAAALWGYGLHLWAGKDYWLEAQLAKPPRIGEEASP